MSLSEIILKTLENTTKLFVEIDGLKYLPYRMMWGSNLQGYKRDSVHAVLSRLNKKGLLLKKTVRGQVHLLLTEQGANFLNKKQTKTKFALNKGIEKWDGTYRFVCFDIPEKERVYRDLLRKALKDAGAVCWQRSIWVTKRNMTRELNEFFDSNGLEDYCSVLDVREVYNLKLKEMLEE